MSEQAVYHTCQPRLVSAATHACLADSKVTQYYLDTKGGWTNGEINPKILREEVGGVSYE